MAKVDLKAEITGSVWKIEVQVGDQIQEEDTLMIMESMKMEIPLFAPLAGVVKEIWVKEGDAVTEGTVALTIEPR